MSGVETIPSADLLREVGEGAARAAGELAHSVFSQRVPVSFTEKKSPSDIVTETDLEAEKIISRWILERVPTSVIIGEEHGLHGTGPVTWHVDPIDGTSNFASGLPFYGTSIAASTQGRVCMGVIYDPERGELFSATHDLATLNHKPIRTLSSKSHDAVVELMTNLPHDGPSEMRGPDELHKLDRWMSSFRAVRKWGSCALHLAYVAAGRVAVCIEQGINSWDIAAGVRLVCTAGGSVLAWDTEGRPVDAIATPERVWGLVAHAAGFRLSESVLRDDLPAAVASTLHQAASASSGRSTSL